MATESVKLKPRPELTKNAVTFLSVSAVKTLADSLQNPFLPSVARTVSEAADAWVQELNQQAEAADDGNVAGGAAEVAPVDRAARKPPLDEHMLIMCDTHMGVAGLYLLEIDSKYLKIGYSDGGYKKRMVAARKQFDGVLKLDTIIPCIAAKTVDDRIKVDPQLQRYHVAIGSPPSEETYNIHAGGIAKKDLIKKVLEIKDSVMNNSTLTIEMAKVNLNSKKLDTSVKLAELANSKLRLEIKKLELQAKLQAK
ncbi:hypothetical protein HXX76_014150 [Chlamydomonas incerta]|uniref:Uncharacterized protein n=1 Tax=Chlamydomonas incerta TaxID=51695 RepID=A0A835VQ17_CHLIN|nr:hypothetical protein HXX76_014150 [Chlamydomonas incerta]|eukprot:KAG2424992.1 hypothetical protein HXX76_014150 [Chlamydomonas incerta]